MNLPRWRVERVLAGGMTEYRVLVQNQPLTKRQEAKTQDGVIISVDSTLYPGASFWRVGQVYAVHNELKPAPYHLALCHVRLLSIRAEDVRRISADGLKAEGYGFGLGLFLEDWTKQHDPQAYQERRRNKNALMTGMGFRAYCINTRPKQHYMAWVLKFEKTVLVESVSK